MKQMIYKLALLSSVWLALSMGINAQCDDVALKFLIAGAPTDGDANGRLAIYNSGTETLWEPLHDDGNNTNNLPVRDDANRILQKNNSIASDDQVLVFKNMPNQRIDILQNDMLPSECTNPVIEILTIPVPSGTVSVSGSSILYTPAVGEQSDEIRYRVYCGDPSTADTAMVLFNIVEKSDDIVDADCYVIPPGINFSIKQLAITSPSDSVINVATPLVGDIDDDGFTEIVVIGGTYPNDQKSKKLLIYEVRDDQILLQQTLAVPEVMSLFAAPFCLANVDGGRYASIFVCTRTGTNLPTDQRHLIKYIYNGTSFSEHTRKPYSNIADKEGGIPFVADFNGDGRAEVVVYDKVYDARTLTLLADGGLLSNAGFGHGGYPYTKKYATFMAVGDLDGDQLPEIAAGDSIYKINIKNTIGTDGNSYTLWSNCDKTGPTGESHGEVGNGATAIADMDGDGLLDVIVTNKGSTNGVSSSGAVYIWNPRTRKVIHTNSIADIPFVNSDAGPSVPFVGDIDDDGEPEVCFTAHEKIYAYDYNQTTKLLTKKWEQTTTDVSGSTTMSMFDFNQDGFTELVYRDQTHLRILNGQTGDQITYFAVKSETGNEYPVVADVNGDNAADIIVTGFLNTMASGSLWIFTGDPAGSWAPARSVWNQFQYNAVNVNKDLTIPRYQLNPATVFSGIDGMLGTVDDVRPYNAFLQQQTALSKNGTPLWLTPNGIVTGKHTLNYDELTDSLIITLEMCNIGDVAFQTPFHITTYKNSIGGSLKHTIAYNQAIHAGDTVSIQFGIPHFNRDWNPYDQIIIQINDSGDGGSDQIVCDDNNRSIIISDLMAIDDRIVVYTDDTDRLLNVLQNDSLPSDCTNPTIQLLSSPLYSGTASVSGSYIQYTPAAGAMADTLRYRVYCGSKVDSATVYISITKKPDNIILDPNCYIPPFATQWSINEGERLGDLTNSTYQSALVGDLDNDGFSEILMPHCPEGYEIDGFPTNTIYIYDMKDKSMSSITTDANFPTSIRGPIGIAKVDQVSEGFIVVASVNGYLYAYTKAGNLIWTTEDSGIRYSDFPSGGVYSATVNFADFNNDGHPELYVKDKIYDLESGTLLLDLNFEINNSNVSMVAVADISGDNKLELIHANNVYQINITNWRSTSGNSYNLYATATAPPFASSGSTSVADFNLDGKLDILVQSRYRFYIWDPYTNAVWIDQSAYVDNGGTPFIGDIDGDGYPEMIYTGISHIAAWDIDGQTTATRKWRLTTNDGSGFTGITLFDFNQDGYAELVYRDIYNLRIINGSLKSHITGNDTIPYNLAQIPCTSGTQGEYPVVVDVDNDGQAEIIITDGENSTNFEKGRVRIFRTGDPTQPWAPARRVWNQYAYNAVNVNNDLTIPQFQFNPATVFVGSDGIMGTADDVRPYNAFLQQQTLINKDGEPFRLAPDVYPDPALTTTVVSNDTATIHVAIVNQGEASIGPPVYVTVYLDTIDFHYIIAVEHDSIQILPDSTGYVSVKVPHVSVIDGVTWIIRVNDNETRFMYQPECDHTNNTMTIINPELNPQMRKDATLLLTPPVAHNGTYSNPVAVLFSENIKYEITATNVSTAITSVQIRDTLPAYLKYLAGTENPTTNFVQTVTTSETPEREILTWTVPNVATGDSTKVSFEATPAEGVCASQPMYINKAWITIGAMQIPTSNSTYHQGAGVSLVAFSASPGGQIFNAEPQAVDYRTAAQAGILVAPDEGYRFDGWSHDAYTSLRGEIISSQKGIMHYDTLLIFGNVHLQACFSPEAYPVHYFLNGAANMADNPETYTIETGTFTLEAPQKTGDVFIGWTGSNGDKPQPQVTIPQGSTGELEFYANFLYSGRESRSPETKMEKDKIWAVKSELFIHTLQTGNLVRIYSVEGMLIKQQEIKIAGETKIKLPRGLYIVTLNNHIGQKIRIE